MRYLIKPVKTGKKGRLKILGEKIDINNIDLNYFRKETGCSENIQIHSAIVRAVAMKASVKVVIVYYLNDNKIKDYTIYFSTDEAHDAPHILDCYGARFQIEFLYRDAKQHTGLNNSQAREVVKLENHFNFSPTAVNIAKAVH
ncbi:MAG: hypothetical protein LBL90_02170 [Prevotellaceae bacterium]|nr:hypothetical protein [Prevotellaceae bacterium]